jgi:hypothetical protein
MSTDAVPETFKLCVTALARESCSEECKEGHVASEHIDEVRDQVKLKQTVNLCRWCCSGKKCDTRSETRLHIPLEWLIPPPGHAIARTPIFVPKKEIRAYESPPRRREQRPAAVKDSSPGIDTKYRPPHLSSRSGAREKHSSRESLQPRSTSAGTRQQPEVLQELSWIRGKVSEAHKINELWKQLAQHTGVDYSTTLTQGAQIEKDICDRVKELSQWLDQQLWALGQTPSVSPRDDSDSDSDNSGGADHSMANFSSHDTNRGCRRGASERGQAPYASS